MFYFTLQFRHSMDKKLASLIDISKHIIFLRFHSTFKTLFKSSIIYQYILDIFGNKSWISRVHSRNFTGNIFQIIIKRKNANFMRIHMNFIFFEAFIAHYTSFFTICLYTTHSDRKIGVLMTENRHNLRLFHRLGRAHGKGDEGNKYIKFDINYSKINNKINNDDLYIF